MIRYYGNGWVKAGFYWRPAGWEIVTVPKGGGRLAGEKDVTYIRLPLPLVVILGPALGAFYVIFLPFIGFALIFGFTAKKCAPLMRKVVGWIMVKLERSANEDG